MAEYIKAPSFDELAIGRLGATVWPNQSQISMLVAALDMAERRILRLEMALRRAGIEVEHIDLPK